MRVLHSYFIREHELSSVLVGIGQLFNVGVRLYLFSTFFQSGLTKLRDWDSTLFLFEEEYQVPLLPPDVAAYMGTAGELLLPAVLVVGLFSRFAAAGIWVVNTVAALSLAELSDAALTQHLFWGTLATYLLVYGAQRWSLDNFFSRRFFYKANSLI